METEAETHEESFAVIRKGPQDSARAWPIFGASLAMSHLEFQCIEGMVGGAAEWPLSEHLHRVEQVMAVSPERTSHLQCALTNNTGAAVDQLRRRKKSF